MRHQHFHSTRAMRLGALAAGLLLLGGCFGGAKVPDQLLTLTAATPLTAAGARSAGPGEAITIVDPSVPQALRTMRVPVYVSEASIQYLKDAQWVENPAPLFARLVGEVVSARTGRVVLDADQFTHDPGQRMTGQLIRFGLDPTSMEAVALFDAVLSRPSGVTTRRFEARVPVAEASAAAIGPALNDAANQVAGQVADWINGAA